MAGVLLQIISLVLVRKFETDCLKVIFLGEGETAIQPWFAVLGANDIHPIVSFPTEGINQNSVGASCYFLHSFPIRFRFSINLKMLIFWWYLFFVGYFTGF